MDNYEERIKHYIYIYIVVKTRKFSDNIVNVEQLLLVKLFPQDVTLCFT